MIVDTHIHLDLYENADALIIRSRQKGVKSIITQGLDPDSNRKSLLLSMKYDIVQPALGIYPPSALKPELDGKGAEWKSYDVKEELKFIESKAKQIMAIGEVGLDYKMTDEREQQNEIFNDIIRLSKRVSKPMSIHSRKAESAVLDFLEDFEIAPSLVVLHCFSGKKSLVKKGMELGYSFSIPTNCVRSEHFKMVIKMVPARQLLTETDGPYLSPFPDKQNEPAFIWETLKLMAEIKEMDIIELSNQVFLNYQRIFL